MGRARLKRYALGTSEGAKAVAAGLAGGSTWFRSAVPRRRLKELMRREDETATKDTALWLGSLVATGAVGGTLLAKGHPLLATPVLAAYGVLYGTASDSRWHECGHGTAFKTRWKNDVVYQVASFLDIKHPTSGRWSHTRHHTDTLILGRDPEIQAMRPARLAKIAVNLVGLYDVPMAMKDMVLHAFGRLNATEATYIPDTEVPKVVREARVWAAIYAAVGATALATRSWLPVVLVGGPRMYGAWLLYVYSFTQHAGLGENVLDHRLNTRTVSMNRLNRFLYMNMNYHVEHHMFPMVPFHALPDLHEEIKHDTAAPYDGIVETYREIIPAVARQLKDQTYYVRRELPPTAAPFHPVDDGRALELPDLPVSPEGGGGPRPSPRPEARGHARPRSRRPRSRTVSRAEVDTGVGHRRET